ncbi:MAG: hypothetical protein IJ324_02695 [Lachnospiraceae bacterium]|nr:hypothetical protein [Lachnospiraceae bacterium]
MNEKFSFKRMISSSAAKGQRNYLNTQKKYEILKTAILFALPLALYITGYVTTGSNANYLTIVAVVGFLPACRSLVQTIMFLRFKSCPPDVAEKIEAAKGELANLYDCAFTAYQDNFMVDHLVVCGNTICGITTDKAFKEKEFQTHLDKILKADNIKNVTIKVFTDENKYVERLGQLQTLEADEKLTLSIISTLLSVSL